MGSVTGYHANRVLKLDDDSIINSGIANNNLFLYTRGGGAINVGDVRGYSGIQGIPGPDGPVPDDPNDDKSYVRLGLDWHDISLVTLVSVEQEVTFVNSSVITVGKQFPTGTFSNRPHIVGANVVAHSSFSAPSSPCHIFTTYLEASTLNFKVKTENNESTTVVAHITLVDFAHSDPSKHGKWSTVTLLDP